MVTKRNNPTSFKTRPSASQKPRQQRKDVPFFLREWREYKGAKPTEIADALGIERESYYRLERLPGRIKLPVVPALARAIGIKPEQFRFPPPKSGDDVQESIDQMIDDAPEDQRELVREMAIKAVRGMLGK